MTELVTKQSVSAELPRRQFENALEELESRFSGRGLARLTRMETEAMDRREAEENDPASLSARVAALLTSGEGDAYRTGKRGNEACMTNEDAKRLFYGLSGHDRIDCKGNEAKMRAAYALYAERNPIRPASVYSITEIAADPSAGDETLPAPTLETPHDERIRRAGELVVRFLPQDRIGRASGVKSFAGVGAGIALIVILALSLMLPVVLSVMINRVSREISADEKTIRSLEQTEEYLEVALEEKNDLRMIGEIAADKYGMIRLDLGTSCYLKLSTGDRIEVFDPEEQPSEGAVLALLSALGIRSDGE